MDDHNKNLLLATALSFLVILVWFVMFPPEQQAPVPPAPQSTASPEALLPPLAVPPPGTAADGLPPGPGTAATAAAAEPTRVAIDTPRLSGTISLRGGRLDDLALRDYRVEVDPATPEVTLFAPVGRLQPYYALYGWAPGGTLAAADVPGATTEWRVEGESALAPGKPLTLVWESPAGLSFRREIAVDENFLFTIRQSVTNTGATPQRLAPYGVVARHGHPDTVNFFILHEGMVRASDGKLEELDYDDMTDLPFSEREAGRTSPVEVTQNGWIGFTDKYWMSTLIAQPGQPFTSVAKYIPQADIYQTEMRLPAVDVAPGETREVTTLLFAGAKEWGTIRGYERALGIDRFIDAIDWGWFFFLTKPIFQALHWLNGLIGNMGWAIIGLTLIIKAILFPLAYKSYVAMARMKELQPEMEAIKERAGDDRQKLQQEMMHLYKTKKVNPAAGCLPILLQIPIFFSLYKVIFVTIELRHAPWFGWIQDLSAPDPSTFLNLFGLLPYDVPHLGIFQILSLGILPILLGVSMWLQMKLNPAPTDKTQAMIFAWMPWIFMFMLGQFASGLVLYWVANNVITFCQQYLIMRSQGYKPDLLGNIRARPGKNAQSKK